MSSGPHGPIFVYRSLEEVEKWQHLVASLVGVCFEVATTVSPVVSNSSPEGNIPEDAILGKQCF